jgi:hypothetical protein
MVCKGAIYLNNAIDNSYYNVSEAQFLHADHIDFFKTYSDLKNARMLSDHLSVFFRM